MITHGGPELFVAFVVIVVTPLLYWLVLKRFRLSVRFISIVALWVTAVLVAYWDVYQISKEARRLCKEEAGLHVYKTVEAEGFLGASSIDYWSKYGFKYVEIETIMGGKNRYTLRDSEIKKEKVDNLLSKYEYITDLEVLEIPFNRQRQIIKDRQTGEILGEIIAFALYPGWLDNRLLGILGFSWSPRACDGDYLPARGQLNYSYTDLVKAVIKPKISTKGE
jgi:uncharacterized membrane protein YraQ (UPF0718 family)